MTRKTISDQLRQAIDAAGMSRYRICKLIDLPEGAMSHFMARKCNLALATIDRLGKLLGLRIVTDKQTARKGRTAKHGKHRK